MISNNIYYFVISLIFASLIIMQMFSLETQGNIAMYIIIIILSFVLSVLTKIAFTNDDQKSSYSNYIYLFGPIILLCIPIIWMITILTRLGID